MQTLPVVDVISSDPIKAADEIVAIYYKAMGLTPGKPAHIAMPDTVDATGIADRIIDLHRQWAPRR